MSDLNTTTLKTATIEASQSNCHPQSDDVTVEV